MFSAHYSFIYYSLGNPHFRDSPSLFKVFPISSLCSECLGPSLNLPTLMWRFMGSVVVCCSLEVFQILQSLIIILLPRIPCLSRTTATKHQSSPAFATYIMGSQPDQNMTLWPANTLFCFYHKRTEGKQSRETL